MKKGRWLAVLGVLLGTAAVPAAAQDDRGLILGGSVGYAQYKDICKRATVPCTDEDEAAWRAFAGYQFSRNWSAELGYAKLGEVSGTGAAGSFKVEVKTWDLSALGGFQLAGPLGVFGRLGIYRARTTIDQEGPAFGSVHDAGTNSGLTYGAGLSFPVWRVGLRAEWQRYENVGTSNTGEDDIDMFSLGVTFRF
jgi:OOP family OmpA-OmpF porin